MTEQETEKQMAAELSVADFKEWCRANGCLGSDDDEYRAILKPLGLDMPPYMWLSGPAQFLYHQMRRAYDLGFSRGMDCGLDHLKKDL
jgi:hypothetical protein